MYLRTFGGLSIEAEMGDGQVPSLGPRRLALLALVAAAGTRGITREKILGILWSETDEEQARHALSQSLYSIRREIGQAWITGTTQLRIDLSANFDVGRFQDALSADRLEEAAALYTGSFLDGFYLPGAPEFERWVEEARSRLQFAALKAFETLARRALDEGAFARAAEWWRRLGELDPYKPAYAAGRIRALTAAGDDAGALSFVREYESRVRRELDVEPDATIVALTAQLREAPPPVAPPPAPLRPPDQPAAAAAMTPSATTAGRATAPGRKRVWMPAAVIAGLVIAAIAWQISRSNAPPAPAPFVAIGTIQSRDTAVLGPVLRDMLATNLARIGGLQVVANSRLLELLPRSADVTSATTADAARRAGAYEIVEGELGAFPEGMVLTLRRVALQSGLVLQGYTIRASDLYALADSATAVIAHDFQLDPPPDAIATVRTRSAVAYALYEQGLRAYYEGDVKGAFRLMNAALERDSTFAMAAAYAWISSRALHHQEEFRLLPVVRRLAVQAVDRERLWIEGMVAAAGAPRTESLAIARELAERFPADPEGQILLGRALIGDGDWTGSIAAYNRATAIDSAAGATSGPHCRVCTALYDLRDVYMSWDSLPAAERTVRRLIAFRPQDPTAWGLLIEPLLRQGRRADSEVALARAARLSPTRLDHSSVLDRDLIRSGRLDEMESRLVSELRTATPDVWGAMPWLLAFTLRNQGRLREAHELATNGIVPRSTRRLDGYRDLNTRAIVALDAGQPREAARIFLDMVTGDRASSDGPGVKARSVTWHMTLGATALAAAGDTAAVRALADSVERIGRQSSISRDPVLHHFLRGLLLQRENRHADAVESFQRSVISLTDGYTRINLELARSLVALKRYDEAIAVLQPAMRGGVDGSNTYVTHTELHEALAHAFHAAGQPDSASVHYAAVERAWRSADPQFAERYRTARTRAMSIR